MILIYGCFFPQRVIVVLLVAISIVWIPVIQNIPTMFDYIQAVTSYLSPPVCAIFILAVFWKRTTEKVIIIYLEKRKFFVLVWIISLMTYQPSHVIKFQNYPCERLVVILFVIPLMKGDLLTRACSPLGRLITKVGREKESLTLCLWIIICLPPNGWMWTNFNLEKYTFANRI